jgi:hypothetical protein
MTNINFQFNVMPKQRQVRLLPSLLNNSFLIEAFLQIKLSNSF